MGANAQTSVPVFTAGQVLTAAQMTQVNTGIPVFASTTERDAAFGGTGEKTLAEGQMAYLEDTNTTQYYDGSAWAAVGGGGLVLIDETTVGSAVASVTMSSVFSATYDTYLVVINGITGSATANLQITFGAAATSYYGAMRSIDRNGNLANVLADNIAYFHVGSVASGSGQQNSAIWIGNPFATETTQAHGTWNRSAIGGYLQGQHNTASSYSSFTITPSTGTITGGTISTFGVVKS